MVEQSILFEAKAFLCWDKFPQLAIKLIPVQDEVAFFYPPSKEVSTINLFYNPGKKDLSRPLFLLFHEAGHFVQWQNYSFKNMEKEFVHHINLDRGKQKADFEREAWDIARKLILEFLKKLKLMSDELEQHFDLFSKTCISSYN